jgi:hypothetical protein
MPPPIPTTGATKRPPPRLQPIAARGTNIGKVSFVPLASVASLNIIGAKGNLNGLQGYLVRLTVKLGDQVVGSAQTLLDGSCPLTLPGPGKGCSLVKRYRCNCTPTR